MGHHVLTAVCIGAFSTAAPVETGSGLKEGLFFPDLQLPRLSDSRLEAVSAFRGKKTLLIVFASW